MVNIIRRFQQPLMIAITVIVCVAFAWLYNSSSYLDKGGGDRVGTIYGRGVTQVQKLREGRKFELCRDLGMGEFLQALAGRAQTMDEAIENFSWNSLVLRHEATALGVGVTDDEVVGAIQAMPVFQTNGAYDSAKYVAIFENALQPRGFGKDQLEDVVRDELRLKRLKAILGATSAATPAEVRAIYDEQYQKFEASVVRLKMEDFLATATAPDEDVKKLYEDRKSQLKSDELRKVKFAAFILPTTDKPLEGKARGEALQKLSKAAGDFIVAMTEKDAKLDEVASKLGVKIEETPDFSRREPPPALADAPRAVAAAFKLTEKEPNSDAITTDRGYYVLQLAGIAPPHPLTFDEAKAQLVEQLKRERAQEALDLKAKEIRNKIEAEIKTGKTFADAAQAAGAKAETFPPFSRAEPAFAQPDAREVMSAAFEMKEGDLGPFTPTMSGGLIIHLDKRPPVDDSKFAAQKDFIADSIVRFQSEVLFAEWLKQRRAEAHIMVPKRG
jgi:peptidyl-prolyl cis-trans isomerase D